MPLSFLSFHCSSDPKRSLSNSNLHFWTNHRTLTFSLKHQSVLVAHLSQPRPIKQLRHLSYLVFASQFRTRKMVFVATYFIWKIHEKDTLASLRGSHCCESSIWVELLKAFRPVIWSPSCFPQRSSTSVCEHDHPLRNRGILGNYHTYIYINEVDRNSNHRLQVILIW